MKLARKIKNRLFRSKKKTQKENAAVIVHPADNRVFSLFDKTKRIEENQQVPVRKISEFSWNGSILKIAGYMYIKGLPLQKEDQVRKRLLLVNNGVLFTAVSLRDVPVDKLSIDTSNVPVEPISGQDFHSRLTFLS
nr:hypothetical protein P5642_19010 [Bacillus subtilis]